MMSDNCFRILQKQLLDREIQTLIIVEASYFNMAMVISDCSISFLGLKCSMINGESKKLIS